LLLEQYRIFYGPHSPAAVAFWATVSAETEGHLLSGASRLRPE
jgi:cytolysin-activating lysine-acyltransferase